MTTIKIILVSEPNRVAAMLSDMPTHQAGWAPYGVQMPSRAGRPVPSFYAPNDGAAVEYAGRMFPGCTSVYKLT